LNWKIIMNTTKFLAVAAFATLAAGASVAAQASTSFGEADNLSPYVHQVEPSNLSRASVKLAVAERSGRTSLGEGSGIVAQKAVHVASSLSRADVRHSAIVAQRNGSIHSGEATFM
jgi:hypothetical protein